MTLIQRLANVESPTSLSNRLRSKRVAGFERLLQSMPRPLRIIDLGGTVAFWEQRGWAGRDDVFITTINLDPEPSAYANITTTRGDVADLAIYPDYSFDIAFSNSVIEHLVTIDRQRKMAAELKRLAPSFWLQTPNFWFPIEPHFHVPGWQWLPPPLRTAIIRRMRCGWRGPCPDRESAMRTVREIRLLRRRQLQGLFPNATIVGERFGGLVKSWIVFDGFDQTSEYRQAA